MSRSPSGSPTLFELPDAPDFDAEERAIRRGQAPVCGLDEAGRGPLAGPVVAAAVILDPDRIPEGLDDSKKLTAAERERLFGELLGHAKAISIAAVSADAIDGSNILRASLEAMRRATALLALTPRYALVDGRDIPPGLPCEAIALVKGDRRSLSIAAASIVAKVARDRMMARCAACHDGYGFESHMGYATAVHRSAITERGPLARIHRLSFAPFRETGEEPVPVEAELVPAAE